jgi:ATP-dependent Clp protease ATP-binding subunit ClpB
MMGCHLYVRLRRTEAFSAAARTNITSNAQRNPSVTTSISSFNKLLPARHSRAALPDGSRPAAGQFRVNSDAFNVLLQLLDDGRLTDGQGRTVDFRNTVVIMTSNLGGYVFADPAASEEERREKVMADVRATFRPEFLNRVDEIIVFSLLGRDDIAAIVDIQVHLLQERLEGRGLNVHLTGSAREYLAEKGFDPMYGARPLKRLIQKEVQDVLAMKLLSGEIRDGDTVEIDRAEDGLQIRSK